ncbi:MAG TPA: site-specific integrase [Candidatus Angelobacter sp.]|nr:site-specific integrase [Candidatus Angelobacter sp.]
MIARLSKKWRDAAGFWATRGKIGQPKSRASKAPVPLHPVLAAFLREWRRETPYRNFSDWVFPSLRLDGKQPRVANMLVEDYLGPAAVKAGVEELQGDRKVRFGLHNLRHSLASFLVDSGTDPKTVQDMPRQGRCADDAEVLFPQQARNEAGGAGPNA